jgi:hypothetical protein
VLEQIKLIRKAPEVECGVHYMRVNGVLKFSHVNAEIHLVVGDRHLVIALNTSSIMQLVNCHSAVNKFSIWQRKNCPHKTVA